MENTATKNTEIMNETEGMETTNQVQPEKPYTFRRLSTQDIFPMLRLLNKIGLKDLKDNDNIKNIVALSTSTAGKKNIDVNKIGMDVFLEVACLIADNIPKCEVELYSLLSQTSDRTVDDIKAQDMAVTFEMIVDFIRKEEFGDFFKAVLKLFK
jgi:hypothetical protein